MTAAEPREYLLQAGRHPQEEQKDAVGKGHGGIRCSNVQAALPGVGQHHEQQGPCKVKLAGFSTLTRAKFPLNLKKSICGC